MVEAYFSTTWQYSFNQIFRVGVNGVLFANTGDTMARRTLTFSGNDIAVSMSRRGSDDNYVTIIPSRIYGLNF